MDASARPTIKGDKMTKEERLKIATEIAEGFKEGKGVSSEAIKNFAKLMIKGREDVK